MSFFIEGHGLFRFMKRISSIVFDRNEQLKRATIITPLGTIKVEWRNGYWISSGDLAAKQLAVPVIQRIERLFP